MPLEARMAVFFLLLAVIVGVVIGDAVVANTGASTVQLFDRSITGFTQGQLLVIVAGAGAPGESTQVSGGLFPHRTPDSLDERAARTEADSTARREAFDQADR